MKRDNIHAVIVGSCSGVCATIIVMMIKGSLYLANTGGKGEWVVAVLLISFALLIIGIIFAFTLMPKMVGHFIDKGPLSGSEPYEPTSNIERAKCLCLQNRYEEAAICYEDALGAEWITQPVWREMARLQAEELENPEKAVEILTQALDDQQWPMGDHIELLHQLADIQFYDIGSRAAAEGIYDFIDLKYGQTPYGKSVLYQGLEMLKPKTEQQAV